MPIDQRKDAAVTPTIVVGFINSPEGKAALAAAGYLDKGEGDIGIPLPNRF